MEIAPHTRTLVSTSISLRIPPGTYGRIVPRLGLSLKHSIDIGAGGIDRDYRGDIKVLLINNSDDKYIVKQGDRIAQ